LENELFITEADLEVRQTAAYQNSDYLLRKTKFKATFALLHKCFMYLKSAPVCTLEPDVLHIRK